jgi:hypothetical protein
VAANGGPGLPEVLAIAFLPPWIGDQAGFRWQQADEQTGAAGAGPPEPPALRHNAFMDGFRR